MSDRVLRTEEPERCWTVPRPVGALITSIIVVALTASDAHAGAWVRPHGELWLKTSVSYWQTDRRFASRDDERLDFAGRDPVEAGDRIPFDPTTAGEFRALSLFADAQLGLFDVLQVGARLPLLWADFNETASADTIDASVGVGDLWLSLQAGLPRPILERLQLAARVDLKLPVGDFDPSVFSAPLTEGQVDVNIAALAGVSLHPFGYANIEAGWRFRLENGENNRIPGDEFRFSVEAGAHLPADLLVKAVFDGVVGFDGQDRFATPAVDLPRRRLFSTWLGVLWSPAERFALQASLRILLAGEDFPTGVQPWLGASYQFDIFGRR